MENDLYIISFWILITLIFNFFFKYIHKLRQLKYIYPAKDNNSWAIVTGGTDGIGLGFVHKLWSIGYNVLIISRNEKKLIDISEKFNFERIKILTVDFTHDDIYQRINTEISKLNVKILINNVGMINKPGIISEIDHNVISDILNCNLKSTIMMSKLVLSKTQNDCVILNVSSITSKIPFPFYSLYSSTKCFIDKFTNDIALEYPNLVIKTINPYFVTTKLSRKKKNSYFSPTPFLYAHNIVEKGYFFPHCIINLFVVILNFTIPETFKRLIKKYILSIIIKF